MKVIGRTGPLRAPPPAPLVDPRAEFVGLRDVTPVATRDSTGDGENGRASLVEEAYSCSLYQYTAESCTTRRRNNYPIRSALLPESQSGRNEDGRTTRYRSRPLRPYVLTLLTFPKELLQLLSMLGQDPARELIQRIGFCRAEPQARQRVLREAAQRPTPRIRQQRPREGGGAHPRRVTQQLGGAARWRRQGAVDARRKSALPNWGSRDVAPCDHDLDVRGHAVVCVGDRPECGSCDGAAASRGTHPK